MKVEVMKHLNHLVFPIIPILIIPIIPKLPIIRYMPLRWNSIFKKVHEVFY